MCLRIWEGSLLVFVGITRATQIRLLIVLALAVVVTLARACVNRQLASLVASRLKPLSRVAIEEPLVSLTFDVTFGEVAPTQVLDALLASGARCTFFVAGPWARAHPDVVRRIVKEGHELGSQGYWHENLSTSSPERIRESIVKNHDILKAISGVEPSLFRPPNGDFDDRVIKTALEVGYTTIVWSLDSFDWRTTNTEYVVNRVTGRAKPGDIVRLHAGDLAVETAGALPAILKGLSSRGLRVVPVSELIRSSPD